MRLALATLFFLPTLLCFSAAPAAAQSGLPVLVASATPRPPTARHRTPVARVAADRPAPTWPPVAHASVPNRLVARVETGITSLWPVGPDAYADYEAYEIEAGTVDGDLFVRWYAFDAHARSFTVEVSVNGHPFETVASVAPVGDGNGEYGVHLDGLAPGSYQIQMRESDADGTEMVSAPVHIRV